MPEFRLESVHILHICVKQSRIHYLNTAIFVFKEKEMEVINGKWKMGCIKTLLSIK
jgi:hypothetical protein